MVEDYAVSVRVVVQPHAVVLHLTVLVVQIPLSRAQTVGELALVERLSVAKLNSLSVGHEEEGLAEDVPSNIEHVPLFVQYLHVVIEKALRHVLQAPAQIHIDRGWKALIVELHDRSGSDTVFKSNTLPETICIVLVGKVHLARLLAFTVVENTAPVVFGYDGVLQRRIELDREAVVLLAELVQQLLLKRYAR